MVRDERRIKLDERSTKCVMFRLSKKSKAYRMYNPETKKIVISRDVKFDEGKGWNWNKKSLEKELTWSESEKEKEIEITADPEGVGEEHVESEGEEQPAVNETNT